MSTWWLWLTWVGSSLIVYVVLRPIAPWKWGWSAAASAVIPPAGVTLWLLTIWLLPRMENATMVNLELLLVPGGMAAVILAGILRFSGVRPGTRYQSVALLTVLYITVTWLAFTLIRWTVSHMKPGW